MPCWIRILEDCHLPGGEEDAIREHLCQLKKESQRKVATPEFRTTDSAIAKDMLKRKIEMAL